MPDDLDEAVEKLLERVPEQLRPWARQYAPAFAQMGVDAVMAWIELLIKGDVTTAYAQVVAAMPNADHASEWQKVLDEWDTANKGNAQAMALQREAASALLRVLLAIALAAVGL
jgi:thioredoxin-like negative regulator of GroEL